MELREWILERLTPVIMVVSSPEAEEMCQKLNGLTVVDLLRPYGIFSQLSGERWPSAEYGCRAIHEHILHQSHHSARRLQEFELETGVLS